MTTAMRGLTIDAHGGLDQLRVRDDLPVPPITRPDEVRVRVHAAALNFPDLLMTQGKYQHRPPLPFVAGMECAGEVIEVGAGVDWPAVGNAVCFGAHAGAFTEELVAPASALGPVSDPALGQALDRVLVRE